MATDPPDPRRVCIYGETLLFRVCGGWVACGGGCRRCRRVLELVALALLPAWAGEIGSGELCRGYCNG